jgi:hypothetical protein
MNAQALASADDKTLRTITLSRVASERGAIASVLEALVEGYRRRLHLAIGFPNFFVYLTDELKFCNSTAGMRLTAVKLCAEMPAILNLIRQGKVSVKKVCMLKDVLKPKNHVELLERASAMTQAEVEGLAARLNPKKVVERPKERLRQVAVRSVRSTPPGGVNETQPEPEPIVMTEIKIVVSGEFMRELEETKNTLSHTHAGASLEEVFLHCMRVARAAHERVAKAKVTKPRSSDPKTKGTGRYIPAAVRRFVHDRDQGCCVFQGVGGRLCGSQFQVQIHHVETYALGDGEATAEELELRCSAHNNHEARLVFGGAFMDRFTKKKPPPTTLGTPGADAPGDTG